MKYCLEKQKHCVSVEYLFQKCEDFDLRTEFSCFSFKEKFVENYLANNNPTEKTFVGAVFELRTKEHSVTLINFKSVPINFCKIFVSGVTHSKIYKHEQILNVYLKHRYLKMFLYQPLPWL